MYLRRILCSLTLAASCSLPLMAASYEDKLAEIDLSNPDSVLALAQWCEQNRYHTRARQHLKQIIKDLDPDHAATREHMGYYYDPDRKRWIFDRNATKKERAGTAQVEDIKDFKAAGPGPKLSDIKWDLTLPRDPDKDGFYTKFLDGIIDTMNRQENHSMEGNYNTLLKDEQIDSAIARLALAMKEGRYTDLYGPAMMLADLKRKNDMVKFDKVKKLLPFMMTAVPKNTNTEDLYSLGFIAGALGDKRVVPQLIELLKNPDEDVQFGARAGLTEITMLPENDITVAKAQEWWDKYHSAPSSLIYMSQLRNKDPGVVLKAAQAITASDWDNAVMPHLIRLIGSSDKGVALQAAKEIFRVSGYDPGIRMNDPAEKIAQKQKAVENWWSEEKGRFTPVHLRGLGDSSSAQEDPQDQYARWVSKMGDFNDASGASSAQVQLRKAGLDAAPALVAGLSDNDGVVRNRCRDLLREMSGKNFGFEGLRGNDGDREKARTQWKAWLESQTAE